MLITSHGHSDVGFVRDNNEDSFVVDEQKGIFAVADGVGGLPHGALASRLAVRFFGSMVNGNDSCSTVRSCVKSPIPFTNISWNAELWSVAKMESAQPFRAFA